MTTTYTEPTPAYIKESTHGYGRAPHPKISSASLVLEGSHPLSTESKTVAPMEVTRSSCDVVHHNCDGEIAGDRSIFGVNEQSISKSSEDQGMDRITMMETGPERRRKFQSFLDAVVADHAGTPATMKVAPSNRRRNFRALLETVSAVHTTTNVKSGCVPCCSFQVAGHKRKRPTEDNDVGRQHKRRRTCCEAADNLSPSLYKVTTKVTGHTSIIDSTSEHSGLDRSGSSPNTKGLADDLGKPSKTMAQESVSTMNTVPHHDEGQSDRISSTRAPNGQLSAYDTALEQHPNPPQHPTRKDNDSASVSHVVLEDMEAKDTSKGKLVIPENESVTAESQSDEDTIKGTMLSQEFQKKSYISGRKQAEKNKSRERDPGSFVKSYVASDTFAQDLHNWLRAKVKFEAADEQCKKEETQLVEDSEAADLQVSEIVGHISRLEWILKHCEGAPSTKQIDRLSRLRKDLDAAYKEAGCVSRKLKKLLDRKKLAEEHYNRCMAKSIARFQGFAEKDFSFVKKKYIIPRKLWNSPTPSELDKISLTSSDKIRVNPWRHKVQSEPSDQLYFSVYETLPGRRGYAELEARGPELHESEKDLLQKRAALLQAEQHHDAHRATYDEQFSAYLRESLQERTKEARRLFSRVFLERNAALVKNLKDAEFAVEQAHAKANALGKSNDWEQTSNFGSVDDKKYVTLPKADNEAAEKWNHGVERVLDDMEFKMGIHILPDKMKGNYQTGILMADERLEGSLDVVERVLDDVESGRRIGILPDKEKDDCQNSNLMVDEKLGGDPDGVDYSELLEHYMLAKQEGLFEQGVEEQAENEQEERGQEEKEQQEKALEGKEKDTHGAGPSVDQDGDIDMEWWEKYSSDPWETASAIAQNTKVHRKTEVWRRSVRRGNC